MSFCTLQVNGRDYCSRVDIFSLGIIFFELFSVFRTEMERHVVRVNHTITTPHHYHTTSLPYHTTPHHYHTTSLPHHTITIPHHIITIPHHITTPLPHHIITTTITSLLPYHLTIPHHCYTTPHKIPYDTIVHTTIYRHIPYVVTIVYVFRMEIVHKKIQ